MEVRCFSSSLIVHLTFCFPVYQVLFVYLPICWFVSLSIVFRLPESCRSGGFHSVYLS